MKKIVLLALGCFVSLTQAAIPAGVIKLKTGIFANGGQATDIKVQTDGKIVVVGYTLVDGQTRWTVARFLSNGKPDTTFNASVTPGYIQSSISPSSARAVALNGSQIIVVGFAKNGTPVPSVRVVYNADGSVAATTFGNQPNMSAYAVTPQGVGGQVFLTNSTFGASLNFVLATPNMNNPATDNTTTKGGAVSLDNSLVVAFSNQSNQSSLAVATTAGAFQSAYGSALSLITSLTALSGTQCFGAACDGTNNILYRIESTSDSDLSLIGSPTYAPLTANTSTVYPFNVGGGVAVSGSNVLSCGSSTALGDRQPCISRSDIATGALDNTFGTNGVTIQQQASLQPGYYANMDIQADGKAVVVGFTNQSGDDEWLIARYTTAGVLDTSFTGIDYTGVLPDTSSPFSMTTNGFIYTTTIDQSGNLVVGGQYDSGALSIRYTTSAGRSGTFGNNGVANLTALNTTATVQKIVTSGTGYLAAGVSTTNRFTTFKLTSTGGFDIAFNGNGVVVETTVGPSAAYDLLINGAALAVAGFTNTNSPSIINYHTTTGAYESLQQFPSFGTGSIYALQKTTNTYAAGQGTNNNTAFLMALIDGTGLLQDTAYPFDDVHAAQIYSGITDRDGNIVLCGNFNGSMMVVRYTADGERDNTFGVDHNGVVQYSLSGPSNGFSLLQDAASGAYIVVGEITVAATTTLAVFKYTNGGLVDASFGINGVVQGASSLGQSRGLGIAQNSIDGSLLVAGQVTVGASLVPAFLLFDASGNLVTEFGVGGVQTFSGYGTGSLYATVVHPTLYATGAGGIATKGTSNIIASLVQIGQGSGNVDQLETGL